MPRQNRAVSPAISTILVVAIVVILAATISVFVLGLGENLQDTSPVVGQSTGELEPVDGGSGGIMTVTHIAGDSIEVRNIEIVVDATDACGKQVRVINLPASFSGQYYGGRQFNDDQNFQGDNDLLAEGYLPQFNQEEWDARVLMDTTENSFNSPDNTLSPGDSFQLRIASGGCDLNNGDQVNLDVVHTPSESIIISKDFTV